MKKRILSLLLMLLFIPAASAMTLPYAAQTVLIPQPMTEAQSALAAFLYPHIFNMADTIQLPTGTRYDDVQSAMTSLTRDYPELFHLGRDYTLSYYASAPEYATAVIPRYRMSKKEAARLRTDLYVAAYLAVSACSDPLALHDHVCAAVTYGGSTEMVHTAVGALLEGRATCEGYAQAVTLLYRMAGIPCGVVTGDATDSSGSTARHAWNIADAGGFTLIDATWNDQDRLGLNTRWYYGLSTLEMAVDHTPDNDLLLPACIHTARPGEYIVGTREELFAALRTFSLEGVLSLRFNDPGLYAAAAGSMSSLLDDFNHRYPQGAFYGSYMLTASDTLMCLILQRAE